MIRLEAITSSPCYWGEMSLDETMNVLEQEPPHSYSNAGHKTILRPSAEGWFCVQVGL